MMMRILEKFQIKNKTLRMIRRQGFQPENIDSSKI